MRQDARPELGRDARRDKAMESFCFSLNSFRFFLHLLGQENISDFVAKKREMFLVQMSLDVKKAEILKLDARAKDKEEAGVKRAETLKHHERRP